MLYHTTHQLFVKTAKEQNKPHKKALPIQRVIDFKLEDNYVISDGHYVYFYRYYAPNTHIMTDDEIQSEIGKLGRLFDTLKCSFSLFATDKVENLEAIKNYYLSLPVRYEYINSEIVESIERSDVESSAVQRAYYIIYRTDSPQENGPKSNVQTTSLRIFEPSDAVSCVRDIHTASSSHRTQFHASPLSGSKAVTLATGRVHSCPAACTENGAGKKASTITSPSRAKPVLFISNLPVCTSQRKTRIPPLFLKKS